MRLIDADVLNEVIKKQSTLSLTKGIIEQFIKSQPTAYDVDKVVERLEVLSDGADDKILVNDGSEQYYDGFGDGVDNAIEIVKDGGKISRVLPIKQTNADRIRSMSKVVLVMDMPEHCIDCPCHFASNYGMVKCGVNDEPLMADDIETFKPDWCPLVAVPDKLQYSDTKGIAMASYIEGWNDCIEKLLAE